MPHRAWILALVLVLPVPAAAVTPYLVKDIETSSFVESSFPKGFASLGRRAVFFTRTRELWSSDGTTAGTVRLVAGEPFLSGALATGKRVAYLLTGDTSAEFHLWVTDGTVAGTFPVTSEAIGFGATDRRGSILAVPGTDRIYFRATVGGEGSELWTSDATPAGTHRVADLVAGAGGSEPHELTSFRGKVFFVADDGRGFSLWSTNGTPAGTRLIKDPAPGRRQIEGPRRLTVVGQTLFFVLPSAEGWFLWKSDGTSAGTVRVAKFARPSPSAPGVSEAIGQLGRLFFTFDDGSGSRELWVSNGTAAGTKRLARFAAPANGIVFPPQLPGRLLFAGVDAAHGTELWSSDGTAAGTRRVKDVCPGACSGFNSPRTVFRGRLHFSGATPARGVEPWTTDGTAAGTRQLKDLCPGACGSHPYPLGATAGKLFFVERDAVGGDDVWRTNGTAQGTVRLTDFAEPRGGELYSGAAAGPRFLFDGSDAQRGRELWATDGTRPGTGLVADLAASVPESSSPEFLRAAGPRVVFLAAQGADGRGLWASDGTGAGTRQILDSAGPVSPFLLSSATSAAHFVYTYSGANGVFEVWRTDGTPEGTILLTPPGVRIETSQPVFALGDTGYFSAEDPEHGEELWVTDGTPGGTHLVADVDPGPSGSQPDRFGSFLGKLVFEARTPLDLVFYVSDGTAAGTRPFAEAYPFLAEARLLGAEIGDEALFLKTDDMNRGEIWATDGTAAGTHRVVGSLLRFGDLSTSGGWFLFRGGESLDDDGVFLSDGTAAGTRRIAQGLTLRSELVPLQAAGSRFVFTASRPSDFDHPALWTTDGTPEGTRPLIETASQFAQPRSAAAFGDRLLLAGGSRIWITDGTPEGTSVVLEAGDLRQAPLPVVAGDRAFFPWFTPETGTELWALRPD